MRYLASFRGRLTVHHYIYFGFFLSALIAWPVLSELEAFELFYDYSRAHEDWDLDELALLIINLTLALLFSALWQTRRLKRLWRDREALRVQAEASARYDPLTGVYNRRAFREILAAAAQTKEGDRPAKADARYLALLDLNQFKPVNELHGHVIGDATLVEVSTRLTQELGSEGVVARLGGDEFAMLFDAHCDIKQVERVTQRLLSDLTEPLLIKGTTVHVGASVGLVQLRMTDTAVDVLRRADKALQQARQGRGQYAWYDEALDQQSRYRAQVAADLRAAIARGEIMPWFQPVVCVENKRVDGLEILARWEHPVYRFVPPDVFVELAEDNGAIGAMGENLLRRACLEARTWDERLTLSFNLSGLQFKDPDLLSSIQRILSETEFPAERLIIEVTERSVIDDFEEAESTLLQLKDIGLSIVLDDFGTGHSSLACLQRLSFDGLKIDRSFVTAVSVGSPNHSIVAGIVSLARGLDLEVTAEGVETEEDLALVSALACQKAQGYLFSKAVPASQVAALLTSSWAGFADGFSKVHSA